MSRLVFFDSNGNEVFDDGDTRITLQKVETNADRIRAMSDAELAEWIWTSVAWQIQNFRHDNQVRDDEAWLEWLKQEAE